MPDGSNPLLEAALQYAGRGWAVLPLHTPVLANVSAPLACSCGRDCGRDAGKHPRLRNGVKGASSDRETIEEWWRQWPDANVGIATGTPPVLDIDGAEFEILRDLAHRRAVLCHPHCRRMA